MGSDPLSDLIPESMKEPLEYFDSLTVKVDYRNNLIATAPGNAVEFRMTTASGLDKTIPINPGVDVLYFGLSRDEIKNHIIDSGGFSPEISFVIPAGGAALRRGPDADIAAFNITLIPVIDGEFRF
jgi:hypothetical protein